MLIPIDIKNIILSSDYLHLQILSLSNRKLKELPEEISILVNLKELDLSYNELIRLPAAITKETRLRKLNLKENTFSFSAQEIVNRGLYSVLVYLARLQNKTGENVFSFITKRLSSKLNVLLTKYLSYFTNIYNQYSEQTLQLDFESSA